MRIFSRIPLFALALAIAAGVLSPQGASAALQTLHVFCQNSSCPDGKLPIGGLLSDSAGNFYGTAFGGGRNDTAGVVFELVPDGAKLKFKLIHRFCSKHTENNFCADGAAPTGNLIEDADGNLYGTTRDGGTSNAGTVFELKPNADRSIFRLFTLYSFCTPTCARGSNPTGGLAYAGQQAGALYDGVSPLFGTTTGGGDASLGVAFQVDFVPGRIRRREKAVYSFCALASCADGENPASLIVDANGNLFGTTPGGGSGSSGIAYELSPQGQGFVQTVLYNFCSVENCTDGRFPADPFSLDAHGNLLGTTQQGGAFNSGTVFRIVPNGAKSKESVLYSFCSVSGCLDGAFPRGKLAIGNGGAIFGSTTEGGTEDFTGGTVFKLRGTSFTVLYSFCAKANCADGKQPSGGVILDGSGNLFGTASGGGSANNGGTVFELKP